MFGNADPLGVSLPNDCNSAGTIPTYRTVGSIYHLGSRRTSRTAGSFEDQLDVILEYYQDDLLAINSVECSREYMCSCPLSCSTKQLQDPPVAIEEGCWQ